MILFPDYMTVYPLNKKKQTLPVSEAYQIIARFFFFYHSDSVAEKESAEEA